MVNSASDTDALQIFPDRSLNSQPTRLPLQIPPDHRVLAFRINWEILVFEMFWDTFCLFCFDSFGCGVQRVVGFAAFRCAAHVSSSVPERDARFGHADKFH